MTAFTLSLGRDVLAGVLAKAALAASTKSTTPILTHVKIECCRDAVRFSTTDFDRWLTLTLPVEGQADGLGAICLPAKRLLDIVSNLPPGAVTIRTNPNGTKALVTSGRSRFEVLGLPPDEFPSQLPEKFTGQIVVDAAVFSGSFARVVTHASDEPGRPMLNGVLLDSDTDGVFLVSCSGPRFARERIAEAADTTGTWTIHRGAAAAIGKLFGVDGPLTIDTSDMHARLSAVGVSLHVRLVDGRFPPYRMFLDKTKQEGAVIDRLALLAAAKRARSVGSFTCLVLGWGRDTLALRAEATDEGITEDTLPCQFGGEPFDIGVNPEFLMDALSIIDADEVSVLMKGPDGTVFVESAHGTPRVLAMIHPLRIIAPPTRISL